MQEPLFVARVVYDLLFFFIVIIIVLNLIFGVIIDTFADLRSEKQQKELVLKNTCFVCGTYSFSSILFPKLKIYSFKIFIITTLVEIKICVTKKKNWFYHISSQKNVIYRSQQKRVW